MKNSIYKKFSIFLLLFAAAMLAGTLKTQAQCKAYYMYSVSGKTVSFYDSSYTKGYTKYTWSFGDGKSSTSKNPSHTYSSYGTYTVCLYIYDTLNRCGDTICQTIKLKACKADFSSSASGLKVTFTNSSTNALYSYWTFGDGSTSTSASPSHTYSAAGTYNVCLYISGACFDTFCTKVTVSSGSGGKSCKASFKNYTPTDTTYFYADTTGNSFMTSYTWSFGDGSSGTGQYVQHKYASSGTYTACLIISTGTCSDTMCDSVYVPTRTTSYYIAGNIYIGDSTSKPADYGHVILIHYNPADSTLSKVDSLAFTPSNKGTYYFSGVIAGKYLVKAFLNKSSSYYKDYLPTYHDSVAMWSDADSVNVIGNSLYSVNVYLRYGDNTSGPGFVAGKVVQGANKKPGDPLDNIEVLLQNSSKKIIRAAMTDANGYFSFSGLPYGTYAVFAEVPGLKPVFKSFTLSAANPNAEDVKIDVNKRTTVTSVKEKQIITMLNDVKMYPNPANEVLNISFNSKEKYKAFVTVTDLAGKVLIHQNAEVISGINKTEINTSALPAGMYFVKIISAQRGSSAEYKFIKTSE